MWEKQFSVLAPTHVTVINSNKNLHFYVSGDNEKLVNEVANALTDNLNLKKKNKILRIKGPAEFFLSFPIKFCRRKGKIHRLNAPAIMKNDNFVTKKFYEFGNFLK